MATLLIVASTASIIPIHDLNKTGIPSEMFALTGFGVE
jgi:hypothetical protein